jgi:hypothetical protein
VMTGASTLGGYLAAVSFNGRTGATRWLDGGFNAPLDVWAYAGADWSSLTTIGKAVVTHCSKTAVAELMGIAWRSVGSIVKHVVEEARSSDSTLDTSEVDSRA